MSFELFTEHAVKEEVREMLLALKSADYAISNLAKEQILQYAGEFSVQVQLRRLKDGNIKVQLKDTTLLEGENHG